ncbi:hypothetical protein ACWEOE_10665 [Amycolatopsis sp. NPDC004368]
MTREKDPLVIEKKRIEPEQMERFEAELRSLRAAAVVRRDKYRAESDAIGYVMADEQRNAYTVALHQLLLATNGVFGEDPSAGEGR